MKLKGQHPLVGTVLQDEFRVERELGSGGMGSVFVATQLSTDRQVAVKVMRATLIDDDMAERFTREAQALSRMSHGNIVTIFTASTAEDGTAFIAMELVNGQALNELITQGPLPLERALPLMLQMTEAVAYAHEQRVLHRDLKPSNVIVRKVLDRDEVKVLDFGLAKALGDLDTGDTTTGRVMGSPPYMSPEQWSEQRDLDGRCDIYALGCIFYQMLTGQLPFNGSSMVGFMRAHTQQVPLSPEQLCPALEGQDTLLQVLRACLARDRNERFGNAHTLLLTLRALQRSLVSGEALTLTLPVGAMRPWSSRLDATEEVPREALWRANEVPSTHAPTTATTSTSAGLKAPATQRQPRWPQVAAAFALLLSGLAVVLLVNNASSDPPRPAIDATHSPNDASGTPVLVRGPNAEVVQTSRDPGRTTDTRAANLDDSGPTTPSLAREGQDARGASPDGPVQGEAGASTQPSRSALTSDSLGSAPMHSGTRSLDAAADDTPPPAEIPSPRILHILSTPSGATVSVDRKRLGKTPYKVILLPQQAITFTLNRRQHHPLTRTVTWKELSPDKDSERTYKLKKRRSTGNGSRQGDGGLNLDKIPIR